MISILCPQARPFTVMKWSTQGFFREDDPQWVEYFPVPTGENEAKDFVVQPHELYDVCVLASAYCPCSLTTAFDNKYILVPEGIKNVDVWSETDLDDFNDEGGKSLRAKFYQRYFPGVIKDTEVTKKKVRNLSHVCQFKNY